MHRSTALRLLSGVHAELLVLEDAGLGTEDIAARLSLEPAAVGPALEVARAKLAALEARDEPTAARQAEEVG